MINFTYHLSCASLLTYGEGGDGEGGGGCVGPGPGSAVVGGIGSGGGGAGCGFGNVGPGLELRSIACTDPTQPTRGFLPIRLLKQHRTAHHKYRLSYSLSFTPPDQTRLRDPPCSSLWQRGLRTSSSTFPVSWWSWVLTAMSPTDTITTSFRLLIQYRQPADLLACITAAACSKSSSSKQ